MDRPLPPLQAVPELPEEGGADEGVDLAASTIDAHLETMAYRAALGATAGVVAASLLDFLR